MLIYRLAVEFEDGTHEELELREGWNVVDVRTDWGGALDAALYGVESGSGFVRVGMECGADGRRLQVLRSADGLFRAVDDGGNVVEGMSGEDCGEVLTGLSREDCRRTARIASPGPDAEGPELEARLEQSQERMKALEEREAALNRRLHEETTDLSKESAPTDLSVMTAAYEAMKRKLDEDNVPELDAISRLRGAIVNIMTAGRQLDKAEAEQEAAERALSDAKAAVDKTQFAGLTPEDAGSVPLRLPFNPVIPRWGPLAFGGAIAVGAAFLFYSPGVWYPVAWILFIALGILTGWGVRKQNAWCEAETAKRREQRERDLTEFALLYREMERTQAEADVKTAAADTLRESLSTNERAILRDIHKFAPEVSSMSEADEQLRLCARRRKDLSIAETVVRKAAALQAEQEAANPMDIPVSALSGEEKLIQALNLVREERAALRLEIRRDKLELSERTTPDAAFREAARRSLEGVALTADFAGRVAELYGDALTAETALEWLSGTDGASWGNAFCLAVRLAVWERAPRTPLVLYGLPYDFDDASRNDVLSRLERLAQDRQILFIT